MTSNPPSNPPSNPVPIPSNPVPSNPLIPPGDWNTPLGLEPSGVFIGQNGVLGIDPGFGGALAWLAFLTDRPAFVRKPGQESQGGSFRTRAAILPEAIPGASKPVFEGVR